jgi:hypothetical protein
MYSTNVLFLVQPGGKIGDRRKSAATSAMSNGSNDASTLLKRGEDRFSCL